MTARTRTVSTWLGGPLALAVLLAAPTAGCPGDLADPDVFASVPVCPGNIDIRELFVTKCGSAICHAGDSPAAELDLVSPGVEFQLLDRESTECEGLVRVDATNPDNSFLLSKITDPPAGCGNRMPLVGALSADEVACMRAFVHSIARPRTDAGAGDGGP